MSTDRLGARQIWRVTLLLISVSANSCGGGGGAAGETVTSIDVPAQVKLVSATSTSGDSLQADWLPGSDDRTSHENLKYNVHVSTFEGFHPTPDTSKASVVGLVSAAANGLIPDTVYYVIVTATDEQGNESWSNPLSVRTVGVIAQRTDANLAVQQAEQAPEVTESTVTFTSSGTTPLAGDIITSAEGDGYLRKVIQAHAENNKVIADTEPAALNQVFEDLDLSTTVALQALPASGVSAAKVGSQSGAKGGVSYQWQSSGLTLHDASPVQRPALLSKTLTVINGERINDGKHVRLKGPVSVSAVPGQPKSFVVFAEINSTEDVELCRLDFFAFGHKDPGLMDTTRQNAPTGSFIRESNTKGSYVFQWTPGENQVDTLGRPYKAVFRAYVDAESDDCSGGDRLAFWSETLEIEVPVLVEMGSPNVAETATFTATGDAGFSIESDFQFNYVPALSIDAQIRRGALERTKVVADVRYDFTQELRIAAAGVASLNQTVVLIPSRKFIKVFVVGTVPVVVTGEFKLSAELSAVARGKANYTETLSVFDTASFGIEYTRAGGWTAVKDFQPEYRFNLRGDAEADADCIVRLVPDLTIKFYEAASGRMLVEPYLGAEIGISGNFSLRRRKRAASSRLGLLV